MAVVAGVPARRVTSGLLVTCLFLLPGAAGASDVSGADSVYILRLGEGGGGPLGDVVGPLLEPPPLPSPEPPLPPTHLRIHLDGDDVVLTWEAPPAGSPLAYRVYRLDLPNGGALNDTLPDNTLPLRAAAQSALIQPYQQVPADATTYRDTEAYLHDHQYVYVVTAVHPGPTQGLLHPHASPSGAGTRSHDGGGEQESPSNPAYTWNLLFPCPVVAVNAPWDWTPPYDYRPECLPSDPSARASPPVAVGVESG